MNVEVGLRMYEAMVRIRISEEQIADLVEASEVATPCHLYIGQEAIAAGVCAALTHDDYLWGGHRSHGHYLAKGGDLRTMMAEIFGRSTGCCRGRGGSMHLFDARVGIFGTVPLVAGTIPLAVGTALAAQLRGDSRVSVSFFGDGAVEEGHCHEAMNLAALYKLPVVFVCENNLYASHMPLLERRVEDNIQRAADVHGMPGVRVDGNDAEAVYQAAATAVLRARRGEGPTLLECRTFRWRGHVGPSWDIDVGVRRKDELDDWLARDPIPRLKGWLVSQGITVRELDAVDAAVHRSVDDAVRFARSSPHPDPREVNEHVFVQERSEHR
jgi:pyruvate dehydrogenase E1 component alpha subunit